MIQGWYIHAIDCDFGDNIWDNIWDFTKKSVIVYNWIT